MKKLLFIALLVLLSSRGAHAVGTCTSAVNTQAATIGITLSGCWYIDYNGGADTNAGTTEGAALKHMPGMNGLKGGGTDHCTNTCAGISGSQAGVGFILKGGSVWPVGVFPLAFAFSGSGSTSTTGCQGSGCTYIGIDPTWNQGTVNSLYTTRDFGCTGSTPPTVTIAAPGAGVTATATVSMLGGQANFSGAKFWMQTFTITNAGSGYTANPTVTLSGGSGCSFSGANKAIVVADITRPIFDLGAPGTQWIQSDSCGATTALFYGIISNCAASSSGSNLEMSSVEVRNVTWNNATGSPSCNTGQNCEPTILQFAQGNHAGFHNIYLHSAQGGSTSVAGADGARGLAITSSTTGEIKNSVVNDIDAAYTCTESGPDVSICSWLSEAAYNAVSVHDNIAAFNEWQIAGATSVLHNEIYGTTTSSVGGHSDMVYLLVGSPSNIVVANTLYYDNENGALSQINTYSNSSYTLSGNVCPEFCGTNGSSFALDVTCGGSCGGTTQFTFLMALNTINAVSGTCMTIGTGAPWMALVIEDNMCVTSAANLYSAGTQPGSVNGNSSPTNATPNATNYKPTSFPSGYTVNNFLTPQLTSDPTQGSVFLGPNLTSSCTGINVGLCTTNSAPGAVNASFVLPASSSVWPAGAAELSGSSPTAGTPTCSPAGGTFSVTQNPTCSVAGGAPVICYTTNGTTPATNGTSGCTTGTLYTGAITISVTTTLKLIAGGTSFTDGPVQTYAYVINPVTTAPAAATFALNVLPLPLAPPIPIISSVSPASTYRGPLGFSQDGKTWATTLQLTLKGSNMTAFCQWANQPLNCTCNSPSLCFETLSMALVPVPSVATVMSGTMSPPAATTPVLN